MEEKFSDCEIQKVGGKPHLNKIDYLYAFIVTEDNKEGIMAAGPTPELQLPLVFADGSNIDKYKDLVKRSAAQEGVKIKLIKFRRAEVIAAKENDVNNS